MRQRISVEQLAELSKEQKDRLRDWWKPEEGDSLVMGNEQHFLSDIGCVGDRLIFTDFDYLGDELAEGNKKDCLPLLSIGQCIELLGDKCKYINPMFYPARFNGWVGDFVFKNGERYQKEHPELIDALWSAVKEVL